MQMLLAVSRHFFTQSINPAKVGRMAETQRGFHKTLYWLEAIGIMNVLMRKCVGIVQKWRWREAEQP